MRALLINPSFAGARNPELSFSFPVGLLSLAAVLEGDGVEVALYDPVRGMDLADLGARLRGMQPDLVGLRVLSETRVEARRVVEVVRAEAPGALVVVGGAHFTALPQQLVPFGADLAVLGEGEVTFREVARRLAKGDDPYEVGGIAFCRDGQVILTAVRPFLEPLDSLPLPALHLIDLDLYRSSINRYESHVIASRGCSFKCSFCDVPVLWGGRVRRHSPLRVAREMARLRDLGARRIYIHDDLFQAAGPWARELCRAVEQEAPGMTWTVRTRVDSLDPEVLEAMRRAGCDRISFGLESGASEVLAQMNKALDLGAVREAFGAARRAGLITTCTLIVGLPGETRRTVGETARLLKEVRPDETFVSLPILFPGTPLYRRACREGLMDDAYWLTDRRLAPIYTGALSYLEMMALLVSEPLCGYTPDLARLPQALWRAFETWRERRG